MSELSIPPLGVFPVPGGMVFSLFSRAAIEINLFLYKIDSQTPFAIHTIDQTFQKEGVWQWCVKNLSPPFEYAYQVIGQTTSPLLLDPYAKYLSTPNLWNHQTSYHPKAIYLDPKPFDWQGVQKPNTPKEKLIIYEMHVRGFTQDCSSNVAYPGLFLGVIEKIPHLVRLNINAVELLPVFEFNECELKNQDLVNFWGYSTVQFFCPMKRYSTAKTHYSPQEEFKLMVRELHKHQIAVILDVVYNHTAEGDESGPTFSFKGLDNQSYYILDSNQNHTNFSGTGNTFSCNHPAGIHLILESLSYFATEFQIDGFRFDLASILTRDPLGVPLSSPPVLQEIEHSPTLSSSILIAEAWDASGLYQVGSFPGNDRWSEWNGKYRDAIRYFLKGSGNPGAFADALCGSSYLYQNHTPQRSLNFVTSHDGYSLFDLVSYEQKHNLANGEFNRDGTNDHYSWNCGQEGPSQDQAILSLRLQQMKNHLAALFLSCGIPMIWMGDESAHSRQGNNNPYCQDNEINWLKWDPSFFSEEMLIFTESIIKFRKKHSYFFEKTRFLTSQDITWHGLSPHKPCWDPTICYLVYCLHKTEKDPKILIAFNASTSILPIELPQVATSWIQVFDTSLPANTVPKDCNFTYLLSPYSCLIAEAKSI